MTTDEWRAKVDATLSEIQRRITRVEVKSEVDEVHRQNVETRLSSIEGTLTWLVRLLIGAIILALLGVVFQGGV